MGRSKRPRWEDQDASIITQVLSTTPGDEYVVEERRGLVGGGKNLKFESENYEQSLISNDCSRLDVELDSAQQSSQEGHVEEYYTEHDGWNDYQDMADTLPEASNEADTSFIPSGSTSWHSGHSDQSAVYISADRSEVHFVVSAPGQGGHMQSKFFFVAIRWVKFEDGVLPVGWCNNRFCPQHVNAQHCHETFEGLHFSERSMRPFTEQNLVCPEAEKLLQTWGGAENLSTSLSAAQPTQESSDPLIQMNGDGNAAAVRCSENFTDWAVVLQHKNVSGWFCTQCPKIHRCVHANAIKSEQTEPAFLMLPPDVFDNKLGREFDCQTDAWKIKAVSQQPWPEDIESDEKLQKIYKDRSAGKMCIPEECSYSAEELEHRACTRCGQSTWAVSGSAKSLVFLPAEIAQTQFHTFSCQSENCCGTLTVDGREHGIFRKTPDLAFAAEVLYQWASGLDCGSPLPWSTSWRRHLVSLTGYDQSTLEAYWKRFKPLFSEATLDFVKLQGIDYGKGFHCNCWQDGITVDGMAMAFKKDKARIEYPWLADPSGPVVHGAPLTARIFVRDPSIRRLLLLFTSEDKGLTEAEHTQLVHLLHPKFSSHDSILVPEDTNSRESLLLPFIEDAITIKNTSNITACPRFRPMLASLCRTAPACQFMRPAAFPLVMFLLGGNHVTIAQQSKLKEVVPILHNFLRPYLAARGLPMYLSQLLHAILLVADNAACPSEDPTTQALSRAETQRLHFSQGSKPATLHPPSSWGREEAMIRTCSWGSLGQDAWEKSDLGGSDVYRPLRRYAADRQSHRGLETCNKFQRSTLNLLPGCVFYWCLSCRKCIFFHVMRDAESPRTIFEVLYTRFPKMPRKICMDNGCNLHTFILNREPQAVRDVEFYIDEAHYRGHKGCCPAYNTGNYEKFMNSPLAEQKNSCLRSSDTQLSYMKQTTFMYYLRYMLYRLNRVQEWTTKGKCFYRK